MQSQNYRQVIEVTCSPNDKPYTATLFVEHIVAVMETPARKDDLCIIELVSGKNLYVRESYADVIKKISADDQL